MTMSRTELQTMGLALRNRSFSFSTVTAASITALTDSIIQLTRATYDHVAALTGNGTFASVVQPLLDLQFYTQKIEKICDTLRFVHSDAAIRKASTDSKDQLDALWIEQSQRRDVYAVLARYEATTYPAEKATLDLENQRYFDWVLREARRNGIAIPDEKIRAERGASATRISELCNAFSKNIAAVETELQFSREELTGLPASWFTPEREVSPGLYRVELVYPDYDPILDYAENRDVRRQVYTAFHSRCVDTNLPLLTEIVQLRQRNAELLEYKTHADYVTETRMAKTRETVQTFLRNMIDRFRPGAVQAIASLRDFARQFENDPTLELQNYDLLYYNRLRAEQEFQLNQKEVESYFNFDKVLAGTFAIYEGLLGLKFRQVASPDVWHPDVMYYEVYNADETRPEKIGSFYLDLYPRDGKYKHFCVTPISSGYDLAGFTGQAGRELPSVAMLGNFSRAESLGFEKGVVRFFHEFGHIMHYLCTLNRNPALHAFSTETDFFEAPSQMLENWCYDPRVLRLLTAHPETGEPLPEAIAVKLQKIKRSGEVIEALRQLVLASFDLEIHSATNATEAKIDLKALYQTIQQRIRPVPSLPQECFAAVFEHIVGGYDVGYYGYMMSNTYALDMYQTKFAANPFDPVAGAEYREKILAPGATRDGIDLLKGFLGRPPRMDAFFDAFGFTGGEQKEAKSESLSTADNKRKAPYFFRDRQPQTNVGQTLQKEETLGKRVKVKQ